MSNIILHLVNLLKIFWHTLKLHHKGILLVRTDISENEIYFKLIDTF